jgi:hypothetical protein
MVFGIMSENEKCANEVAFIQPTTLTTLLQVGVSQSGQIVLEPNWGFVGGMMFGLLCLIMLLLGVLYYLQNKSWKSTARLMTPYKLESRKMGKLTSINSDAQCF